MVAARARAGATRFFSRIGIVVIGGGGPKLRRKAVRRSAFCRHTCIFSANAAGSCGRSPGFVRSIRLTRFRTNRGTAAPDVERRAPDSAAAGGAAPVNKNHIAAPREKI